MGNKIVSLRKTIQFSIWLDEEIKRWWSLFLCFFAMFVLIFSESLTPFWSVPDFWKINLGKSSLTNWIFSLKTGRLKRSQFSFLFLSSEKLKKLFYFFTYILIDNLVHEITKEFWKNSHLASMREGFLLRRQNSLR